MKQPLIVVLKRALAMKCPACGRAPIFDRSGWTLHNTCPSCGLDLRDREQNTYFFMYVSTAAITGVFLLFMLFFMPGNVPLARVLVIAVSSAVFIGTIPLRKSIAIALDYLF